MRTIIQAAHQSSGPAGSKMSQWLRQVVGSQYHRFCPNEIWQPALNFYESDDAYYIVADLAGLKAEEIDLHVESQILHISGERPTPRPCDAPRAVRLHMMEIDHGRFCRELQLPEDVDPDRIEASYRSGLLQIRLPRKGR